MRNFLVNVNGTQYEVAVEEIDGTAAPAAKQAPAAAPKAAPVSAAPAGGTKVTAPMPGTILGIKVKDGDVVKAGQPIFVLEAMKMESDISAPVTGTVRSVSVSKGASVEAGTYLCSIE